MHPLEVSILEAFKQEPSKTFSTTELVRLVFRQDYGAINASIHHADKKEARHGFAMKGKLHRKLLYHVNSLVDQQLLLVSGTRGKGEKLFRLALEEGELVIREKKQRIVIAKPPAISTQIDGYEQQGLVRKFCPESWLHKENSVMLDCDAFASALALHQRLETILPAVNDVVALHAFEGLIGRSEPEELDRFLQATILDTKDYDVRLSILINLSALEKQEELLRILQPIVSEPHINVVFAVTPRILAKQDAFLQHLFTLFSDRRAKLTLRNSSIFPAPIFFGKAGAYSLSQAEWDYYNDRIKGHVDGCAVGHTSVAIDIDKYFAAHGTATGFREMVVGTARAFFEIDERRRRHGAAFAVLAQGPGTKEFFKVGKDYLRFWNYDWAQEDRSIIDLLTSVEEEVEKFCRTEETIFRSCGLPIRFSVSLSTSFAKFDQDFFSERRYTKTVVSSLKDLQTKEMTAYLRIRERLFKVFDGADRVRFFFARGVSVEETLQMARYLLRAYDLPTFTFDFRGKSGELKLTGFLEDG